MELGTDDGILLQFTIVGYQYPELAEELYDSNWLLIRLDATTANGSWSVTDACLLTYEAQRLADWLSALAQGTNTPSCEFIEPCLRFESVSATLCVILDHAFRPPWAADHGTRDDGYRIDLALTATDLQTAATTLRQGLIPYPQRAER